MYIIIEKKLNTQWLLISFDISRNDIIVKAVTHSSGVIIFDDKKRLAKSLLFKFLNCNLNALHRPQVAMPESIACNL